jgi:hypothetical protein
MVGQVLCVEKIQFCKVFAGIQRFHLFSGIRKVQGCALLEMMKRCGPVHSRTAQA